MIDLPRILLVTASTFNPYSGGGVTLTNLFRGWFADRIAMIHSDPLPPDERVCQRFYRLGAAEIKMMWPLAELQTLLRGARSSQVTPPSLTNSQKGTPEAPRAAGGIKSRLYRLVAGHGLPMRVQVSPALDEFIVGFRPNLIYTFLGDIPYMRLVNAILERHPVPFVVHMMDDWPTVLYQRGWFAPWLRPQVDPMLRDLLSQAALRMGICDSMGQAYEERYGLPFITFHNPVDVLQWQHHPKVCYEAGTPFRLLYSGSIVHNAQLTSLCDIVEAVARLAEAGVLIEMVIHTPSYSDVYRQKLERPPIVRFAPPPTDDNIVALFTEADLLLLPVNFDADSVQYIRYSMPTKIPAYLASGTPTLAYGPPGVAQIDYARSGGWGYVVPERGIAHVEAAIRVLMEDKELRARLGQRGVELAKHNHDATVVRPAFQNALREAAFGVCRPNRWERKPAHNDP